MKLWLLIAPMLLFSSPPARSHETRPAYLEIKETASGQYRMLWKRPILGEVALPLDLRLPGSCQDVEAPTRYATLGSLTERRVITCGEGLSGKTISIDGLEASITDALVRIQTGNGRTQTRLLKPASPSFVVPEARLFGGVAVEYVFLGIDHILRGIDHLLFVLGLLLIVANRWMLFKTITSFTVAHSITLGAATLGYASVSVPPLSAVIALSILFLGPEIVRQHDARYVRRDARYDMKDTGNEIRDAGSRIANHVSLTTRYPWIVAFAFGLLHGFGFASGLTELGLPRAEIPVALLLFNVGVELGQIGFLVMIFALDKSFRLLEIKWPRWVELVPGYAVGSLGAFWTIERTVMMLGVIK
ncbi:MAG TPA: HupE/UreJ family protein [Candidatus Binatia bacterium]|nr:HupE/UreJ family protein [Candidatus Binatia bacterium]